MKRRTFMAASAAAAATATLARPAIAQGVKPLIFVPQGNVVTMDAVWTTATTTRNAAAMVFETLYGRDAKMNPKPQMVEGALVEDGGKRWTLTLRDGLSFHDGEKVLARDCVASIKRWMKRDPAGQTIEERMDALEVKDDRSLVFRLKKPFAGLPAALSKTQPTPVMMPERIANTDPFKQITEVIGSGPFRYVAKEYVSGNLIVFEKNGKYIPRNEPVSYTSGGLRAMVERVEWKIIPDAATAANALVSGEVDWLEAPLPDLLDMLRKSAGITVGVLDETGYFGVLRPNWTQGPTANVALRRAMLAAIDQVEVMTATMGEDKSLYHAPVGMFLPGSVAENQAGMDLVRTRRSVAEIKAMVKASGYNGEKIVLFHPTDQVFYNAIVSVAAQAFRQIGLNIDEQSVDWGTVVQRRTSHEPLEKGGWSMFPAGFPAVEYVDPLLATGIRANGAKAWFGWPEDAKLEQLREQWLDETDPAAQLKLCEQIQARCLDLVTIIPVGQYLPPAAWTKKISAPLKGLCPVFWGVAKTV
jgi:peptide/nickel transport system substrate-binding protein